MIRLKELLLEASMKRTPKERMFALENWLSHKIANAPGESHQEKLDWLWKNDADYGKVATVLRKTRFSPFKANTFVADRYYIRFGDIPKKGKSYNYLYRHHEIGVSAYEAKWNVSKNKWEIVEDGLNGEGLASLYELTYNVLHGENKRPIYLLQGQELNDVGGDGEAMLDPKDVKIIKKLEPHDFFSYELGDDWYVD